MQQIYTRPINNNVAAKQPICFHCHDTCNNDHLYLEDKYFCCNGCKMVFEILNANNLCTYYTLDPDAGKSLKDKKSIPLFTYLDDPEVQEKLLTFRSDSVAQIEFYIPQMHCVSCIWLLEHLSKLDHGVTHARVNFYKKKVHIQYDPRLTTLSKIAAILADIGYKPEINLADIEDVKPSSVSKKLSLQIAVAGFAVGNIMLFSFPEYVGMDADHFRLYANVFGYLSLILALPVLLFSARDYFIAAYQGILHRRLNIEIPLCLALLSLFLRSVWEITTHTGAGYLDSFAGLTFLLLIGKWFQQKTWNQLSFERNYKSYFPVSALRKEGQTETAVSINRLVPGDIIVVKSQEIIPADGLLLKGSALIDYSFITGESVPVLVNSGERIFAGGKQMGASIELSLTHPASQSHLTQLWNNEAFKRTDTPNGSVRSLADQAGWFFSWVILLVGGSALGYWWLVRGDVPTAINAFTAVMIVACPCTIALSIPFTMGNILRILGRHRFYLKNNEAVEALSAFDAVAFDKTGTISSLSQEHIDFIGLELDQTAKTLIKSLTYHSTHPLSRKICATIPDIKVAAVDQFEEIPGYGISGVVLNHRVKVGSASFVGVKNHQKSGVFVAIDDLILGYFDIKNQYRYGLQSVLEFFRKTQKVQKVTTPIYLLSGDQDQEMVALLPFFPDKNTMHFQLNPQEKLDFIKNLQEKGQNILFLGDGLNDAGALRQSNMGIVVSENTNNFTPASDAILDARSFEQLPQFIQLAKSGVSIVQYSYGVAVLYNIIGLSYAVGGHLSPLVAAILMPISSVSIVLFGVGMGNLKAKRLKL
jgi:P-type Cu+ transporter